MYSTTPSLADPPAGNPIADGIFWMQGAALGSTATTIAVIAISAVGLLMLSGRIELRRGITVVVGCFILFGAPTLADALTGLRSSEEGSASVATADTRQLQIPQRTRALTPSTYDPYAGASVPTAR